MPLGIFGGSSSNGPKPQPLTSEKEKREKGSGSGSGLLEIKDSKGATIKLCKKSYTVEKKLAEGGFAIVYLVTDKHGRNYALKRQLIRDDPRQLEACRTEFQIVKNLNGHKNIVAYVNHQLTMNKVGIYDYMLLTVYYPTNVLQLMNSRLLSNRWLSSSEILDVFCDVCEAVARLHHSKTPVIHRDLKVENVLIDQRTGTEKSLYVLCDFGSATTKVFSKETHNQAYMEEEIRRYTTLSYRAPEMIDVFSGVPITTKSDIWALGVLLYKICYFALPFGESALAIQNGIFTFPDQPNVPEEIKAIINLLLTSSARHRPNIFQTAYLAFAAANKKCPIYNIERSARIELTEAVQILRLRAKLGANYARLFEKAFNDFENAKKCPAQPQADCAATSASISGAADSKPLSDASGADGKSESFISMPMEGVIVNTSMAGPRSSTTSVNPRLRPKATNTSHILSSPFGVVPPMSARHSSTSTPTPAAVSGTTPVVPTSTASSVKAVTRSSADQYQSAKPTFADEPASVSDVVPTATVFSVSHSTSSDNSKSSVTSAAGGEGQETCEASGQPPAPSFLKSSAFKPYSMLASKQKQQEDTATSVESSKKDCSPQSGKAIATPFESSNPFISGSTSGGFTFVSDSSPPTMDDNLFGERFDELRRVNRRNTIEATTAENGGILSAHPCEAVIPAPSASASALRSDAASIPAPQRQQCQQQHDAFLLAQKQRFVPNSTTLPRPLDIEWLERAIDEDPFGRAPALSHDQLNAVTLMAKVRRRSDETTIAKT